jgi:general secretion pathway protein A
MYESFYNFSELPFRLTPDPRFYFSSATHKRALTHLRFGFHQREGFVVITGKPGTGKTELMLHLLEGLPQERITYGKIVTSNLDANEILQQVAGAFHIPAERMKKGILLKKLEDVFLQHVRENKRLVLIVDEAHKLSLNSLNELQMLTNFQLSGKAALQCFLSGHDSLKVHLQNPELLHLKQRVITSTFLMPLERRETAEYIEHRMRCVGWEGDPKFNQSAYSLIHETTEGIPRQINALCNRILLRAYAEQKHYIDEGMVSRAIDDVQSEPLATNVPYQQALAETNTESFQESQRFAQEVAINHPEGVEHSAAYEQVNEQITFPDNDQDETLPLPSAVNHDPRPMHNENRVREVSWSFAENNSRSVARGARNVPPGHGGNNHQPGINETHEDRDGEIDDEVRKMSDALSDFHSKTATSPSNQKIPPQNTDQHFPIVPVSGKNHPYVKKRAADTMRQTKPKRSWAVALSYGSVAFLFIAVGVFLWGYKFSNDVLGPLQAEDIANNSFLAAIKDMLPAQNIESTKNGQTLGEVNNESGSEVIVTEPAHGSTPEADQAISPIAALANSMQNQEEPVKTDTGSEDEHWDSGALGSQFLSAQVDQPSQPNEKPISGSEFSVAEVNEEAAKSLPDLSTQATNIPESVSESVSESAPDIAPEKDLLEHTQAQPIKTAKPNKSTKQIETKTPKSQIVIASAVNAPKTNKSSESGITVPQNPKSQAANLQPEATTAPKTPARTTKAAQSANHPAKKPVAVEPIDEQLAKNTKPQKSPATVKSAIEAPKPVEKKTTATSNAPSPRGSVSLSKNVVILNPGQVSPTEESREDINQLQLNALLDRLTSAYEKGNLQQLLSVLSNDIRSNDGSTRRDLKSGYRKLFNITDMRKMTISSVNWSKKNRFIHGEGEFKLSVREKGSDKVTSYGGIISLDVDDKGEKAVITRLNYDYK